jgi:hypothetical protein
MVEDAIRGYLKALTKNGEEIPVEHGERITQRVAGNFLVRMSRRHAQGRDLGP